MWEHILSITSLLYYTNNQTGRGGDQVVSVIAFHSDDPSSNSADAHSFF